MLKIGQKLFRVQTLNVRGEPAKSWITITKVGRKWACTINDGGWDNEQIHIKKLHINGGEYSSPAQCYLSEEEYEETTLKNKLWNGFKNSLGGSDPSHLSLKQVQEIIKMYQGNTK